MDWHVREYDSGVSWGRTELVNATKNSITVFVGLNQKSGPATTKQVAVELGIPEDTTLDDSLLNVLGFGASQYRSGSRLFDQYFWRSADYPGHRPRGSAWRFEGFPTTVNPKQVFDTKTINNGPSGAAVQTAFWV